MEVWFNILLIQIFSTMSDFDKVSTDVSIWYCSFSFVVSHLVSVPRCVVKRGRIRKQPTCYSSVPSSNSQRSVMDSSVPLSALTVCEALLLSWVLFLSLLCPFLLFVLTLPWCFPGLSPQTFFLCVLILWVTSLSLRTYILFYTRETTMWYPRSSFLPWVSIWMSK